MERDDREIEHSPEGQPAPQQADIVQAEYAGVSLTAEVWSGPLPHPGTLERYEKLIPGSAERLLTAFERQVAHRHSLDNRESRRLDWGLVAAFLAVVMIITAGAILIYLGHDWAGAGMIGVNIVGLAAVFISGASRRKERKPPQDSDQRSSR